MYVFSGVTMFWIRGILLIVFVFIMKVICIFCIIILVSLSGVRCVSGFSAGFRIRRCGFLGSRPVCLILRLLSRSSSMLISLISQTILEFLKTLFIFSHSDA